MCCCRLDTGRHMVNHLVNLVRWTHGLYSLILFILILSQPHTPTAQTEGDTGYDYGDAYEEDFADGDGLGIEPSFDVQLVNVTVVQGQTVVLPCSINHLGKLKVAWLDSENKPLTYEDRRVVDDSRFSIVRPYVREWNLQIREVKWDDQGPYLCVINTDPTKSKKIMLHVKVPAQIIDELSSDDVTVQEGDTVVLICNVTGVPRPEVTWHRMPVGGKVSERQSKACKTPGKGPGIGMTGEMIIIQNVSRYCDNQYECVARNGVPPSVSRKMRVTVEFQPEIHIKNQRIGQQLGKDTILECHITAFPHAVNYWMKDGERISSSSKYRIDAFDEEGQEIILSLWINELEEKDFGRYKCVAANSLGSDEETMIVYKYPTPTPHASTPYVVVQTLNPTSGGQTFWTKHSTHNPKGSRNGNGNEVIKGSQTDPVSKGNVMGGVTTGHYSVSLLLLACLLHMIIRL